MSTMYNTSNWDKATRYAQDLHDISTLNYFSASNRFSPTDSIFKISIVPYGDEKNIYPLEFKDDGSVYLVSPKLPIDNDLIWMVKIQFNMDLFEYSDTLSHSGALAYVIKPEYNDTPILLGRDTLSFLSYDYNALFESGVIAYPSGITIPVYSLNNKDNQKLRETTYMLYPKANMAIAVYKHISICNFTSCNFTSWCDVIGEAGIKYYNIKTGLMK